IEIGLLLEAGFRRLTNLGPRSFEPYVVQIDEVPGNLVLEEPLREPVESAVAQTFPDCELGRLAQVFEVDMARQGPAARRADRPHRLEPFPKAFHLLLTGLGEIPTKTPPQVLGVQEVATRHRLGRLAFR